MIINNWKLTLATVVLITSAAPSHAVDLTPELTAFCSKTRDNYISEVNKRFQTQTYKGYSKGKGGVGIGVFSDFGSGAGGGAEFGYDWTRTWDDFDQTQKKEYESKNCNEVLRQWGQISVAEILADKEKAIAQMQLEKDKYGEDTKRILGQLDFEATKVHYQALVRIVELNQAGRIEEAKILAESGQRIVKMQEEGQTERLRIEKDALLAMTKSNNELELKKAQLDASVKRQQNLFDFFKQGLISWIELQKEKEITRREIAKLKLEIKKLEVQKNLDNKVITSTQEALLASTNKQCGATLSCACQVPVGKQLTLLSQPVRNPDSVAKQMIVKFNRLPDCHLSEAIVWFDEWSGW